MTEPEEFRAYMKAVNRPSDTSDEHLNEAQMIAYCRGEMEEVDREAARAHLVHCEQCITLFRNARDFLDPERSEEEDITITETDEAWRSLAARLPLKSDRTVVTSDFKRPRDSKVPARVTFALAASLLITFGLLWGQTWRLSRERESLRQSQEITAQSENSKRELEQRLAQLEQTSADQLKRERDERLAAEAERDQLLAQLKTSPQVSEFVPLYSFRLSSERGGENKLRLRFAPSVKTPRLRLIINKPYEFERFAVEFVDSNGKTVQTVPGLRPKGDEGALTFRVNRATFSAGNYRLRLFGVRGETRQQLGNYGLSVTVDR